MRRGLAMTVPYPYFTRRVASCQKSYAETEPWHSSPSLTLFLQLPSIWLHFIFSELSITLRNRLEQSKYWPQSEPCWKMSHCPHNKSWAHPFLLPALGTWAAQSTPHHLEFFLILRAILSICKQYVKGTKKQTKTFQYLARFFPAFTLWLAYQV